MNRPVISLGVFASISLAASTVFAQSVIEPPPLLITPTDTARTGPPPYIAPAAAPRMGPPPALPAPIVVAADTTVELAPTPVPFVNRPSPRARVALLEDDTRFQDRRLLRVFVATMASAGATLLGGALAAGTFSLVNAAVPCSWFCSPAEAFALAGVVGLASTFALAGAFTVAANQFGARGSYWAAFGGWWAGAATAALFSGIAVASSAGVQLFVPIAATTFSLLPFVGQALVFEATARPSEIEHRTRSASASSVRPALSIGRDGLPTLSMYGVF